jgi:hypothetical protein
MLPIPREMSPVSCGGFDLPAQTLRILQAHESLAGLSDRNRLEFDPLLEVLRKEMASGRPGAG